MFFGGSASGLAMAVGVSDEVLAYRATIQQVAQKYGMEAYVELLMAVMMQESGGRGSDPMQAAEGGFNKKYPPCPQRHHRSCLFHRMWDSGIKVCTG